MNWEPLGWGLYENQDICAFIRSRGRTFHKTTIWGKLTQLGTVATPGNRKYQNYLPHHESTPL